MIIAGSFLPVVDGTGVLEVKCIKVLGKLPKAAAYIGDKLVVVVFRYSLELGYLRNEKKKDRFTKGRKFYALVIRSKVGLQRKLGLNIRFTDNAIVLINKRLVPLSSRIRGPIPVELLDTYPALSAIVSYVI